MKKYSLLWMLVLLFFAPPAEAQEILRNEEGRSIIVYPDGSWRYFEADSAAVAGAGEEGIFLPEAERLAQNRQRYEEAKKQEAQIALELIGVRLEKVEAGQDLSQAGKKSEETAKVATAQARLRLKLIGEREEQLIKDYELAKKRTKFLQKIQQYPAGVYENELAAWEKKYVNAQSSVSEKTAAGQKKYREYDPAGDVMLNPPARPCKVEFEGKDALGNLRRDLKPETIFTQTDPALRAHFQQSDFINGQGYLTKISGGIQVFTLEVMVATKRAPELFGVFKQGDFIELQLLDGNVVRLFNNLNDPGKWQPTLQAYVYRAQYSIGIKEEKMLRSSELDFVRVRWSKVQDEFPVYEIDFFFRQFGCVDSFQGS